MLMVLIVKELSTGLYSNQIIHAQSDQLFKIRDGAICINKSLPCVISSSLYSLLLIRHIVLFKITCG
jgi:hypothetical protein